MSTIMIIIICSILGAALLYLLMIMPRVNNRVQNTDLRQVLYAHRGLHDNDGEAPENSMEAFRRAVDGGFGIELDIQLTRDKLPVVFHDFTLKRVCGAEGKVKDYSYQELQKFHLCTSEEKIPLLSEVLKLVDGKVPLIVEFKIEAADISLCPVADKLLREYKGPYCMESFNPLGVLWYRKHHREVIRGQLSDAFTRDKNYQGILYFVLQNLLFNGLTKPDFIAYNHKYPRKLSRLLCKRMFGNTAVAWTIKSEAELEAAKKQFDMYIFDSFYPHQGSRA